MTERFSALLRVVLLAIVCTSFLPTASRAQISGEMAAELLESAQTNPLLLLRQRLSQAALANTALPLEGMVDDNEYLVGPGDAFSIIINGQDVSGAPVLVGADGYLTLPDAGLVRVGGLTLAEARSRSVEALNAYYEDAQADISLTQSRQFYVHVTGAVPVPGRFLALPVSRVSNVLELAFADTTSLASTNREFQPSLRNVEVRHTNGTSSRIDLVRYLTAGDTSSNPYLQDGDIVHVPSFNPEYRSVSIGGRVPFPGMYEFRDGDTLRDLLAMAGGLTADGGVEQVVLTRLNGAVPETRSMDLARFDEEADVALQPLDVVSVIEEQEKRGLVRLDGRVVRPGSYPIIDGVTTLQDLLSAAGGLREDALPRGAYLERRSLPDPSTQATPDRNTSVRQAARQMARVDTAAVFQRLRLTDLDFMSRSYFARELSFQHRVSIDLPAVLDGRSDPIVLRSGDRLFVPRDEQSVYVLGQVLQPGYITLRPGQTAAYYLERAGGRSAVAGQTIIINPATGAVSEDLTRELQSGDLIFVDSKINVAGDPELERLNIERDRSRSNARIQTMQALIQGVGTLASLITLIITIRRN
jgi:polysaccharide export outer membrane protein